MRSGASGTPRCSIRTAIRSTCSRRCADGRACRRGGIRCSPWNSTGQACWRVRPAGTGRTTCGPAGRASPTTSTSGSRFPIRGTCGRDPGSKWISKLLGTGRLRDRLPVSGTRTGPRHDDRLAHRPRPGRHLRRAERPVFRRAADRLPGLRLPVLPRRMPCPGWTTDIKRWIGGVRSLSAEALADPTAGSPASSPTPWPP